MKQFDTCSPDTSQHLRMTQPMAYQIKVFGWLDQDWSDWFDGLTITTQAEADNQPVTVLTGCVIDQAALHGILNKIANLGLPLLAVKCLPSTSTDSQS